MEADAHAEREVGRETDTASVTIC